MRSQSVYQIECLCGRTFERPSDESFSCPSCGRALIIDFRGCKSAESQSTNGESSSCQTVIATTN
jgi:predicted RNA-binding Zn-ribbon protein involved in translation (DUF1610 family)